MRYKFLSAPKELGLSMHALCARLTPLPRSITGQGFRDSLSLLDSELGGGVLERFAIASGERAFDWIVPDEWAVDEAYIITPDNEKICDFSKNRLHLVGYSVPTELEIELDELDKHLFSLPDMPKAIPYITSYYKPFWGFCLSQEQRQNLKPGKYKVRIKSKHFKGELNYAQSLVKATIPKSKGEILISSYLCHPQMANNELSGPVVLTYLLGWVLAQKHRSYDYRFVIVPETIGSIVYISRHLKELKQNVKAGYVLTCIGDERAYSFLSSPSGDTLADRAAKLALSQHAKEFKSYDFRQRGSDERQYCSPLVNLPVASIMRSKYGEYKEYHTSLDDLSLVTPDGLAGGLEAVKLAIKNIEYNAKFITTLECEPNLGSRGLYPTISSTQNAKENPFAYLYRDIIAFCDGKRDLIEIAWILNASVESLFKAAKKLEGAGLLKEIKE